VVAVAGASPSETWKTIEKSWRATMKELADGKIRAPFEWDDVPQKEFEDDVSMAPPKCKFCDYVTLCGRD